jgi:hypothetical protein
MPDQLGHSVPEVQRVEVGEAQTAAFKSEREFTSLAVSLLVETASYNCIAAGTLGKAKSWKRDIAAVGGNIVRQYKLLDAFIDQVCKDRDETAMIMARLVFETTVNARYLIKHFSPSLIDSYVRLSLRHERKVRDKILNNVQDRNGVFLPIEDRMLQSLDRAERASGIKLNSVDLKDKRPWGEKNIFEKARAVGLDKLYSAAFGGGSHSIHGNWQEVYSNHLEWNEATNDFTPKLNWRRPRPQLVTAIALAVNETIKSYFDFIGDGELNDHFHSKLDDLHDRVLDLVDAHEKYLANKRWPAV